MSGLDWAGLASNGVWVLGVAVVLAAFSFYCYDAHVRRDKLRARLSSPGFQAWLMAGLALASLGGALTVSRWWERVLWGLLCAVSMWQTWLAWRAWQTKEPLRHPSDEKGD